MSPTQSRAYKLSSFIPIVMETTPSMMPDLLLPWNQAKKKLQRPPDRAWQIQHLRQLHILLHADELADRLSWIHLHDRIQYVIETGSQTVTTPDWMKDGSVQRMVCLSELDVGCSLGWVRRWQGHILTSLQVPQIMMPKPEDSLMRTGHGHMACCLQGNLPQDLSNICRGGPKHYQNL
ncbi:hypothetical protein EV421DRAFT_1732638 [Armillaria borealis]|uniref:Uncharacterized protein n=1 Tax=Armillaria borealis TaxID=47425 RepID=A0AA39JZC1_9AGAR|nr:hypothetical protein EV421DRAFT_1732638 [Armillaria borealis]